jgi:uncharacterized membrane protein
VAAAREEGGEAMNLTEFLFHLDDDRIVAAIREAENRSSAEIRVYIADGRPTDPVAAALEHFDRAGMSRTRDRNAVLVYVAPRSQTFAVVGDEAAHRCCGDGFWQTVSDEMRQRFGDDPNAAIVHAIFRVADRLSGEFPCRVDDRNELPDQVLRGR